MGPACVDGQKGQISRGRIIGLRHIAGEIEGSAENELDQSTLR